MKVGMKHSSGVMRSWILTTAVAAACGSIVHARAAQAAIAPSYPEKPIRMIGPFSAGGGADALARTLARKLSEIFQQQVVVDNRGGASGIIGTEIAARAAPDGYTVVFIMGAHAINAAIRRELPYDPVQDFSPVSLFTAMPLILGTHPSFAPRSVPELLALARAKPGQINYASTGTGSVPHFAAEMMKIYAKVDIVHVSYKGMPGVITDVLAGAVPLSFLGPSGVSQHIRAGKLRALAITSVKRSPSWPDLPTMQEGGVPNYDFTSWYGLLAPRNTPIPVVARLTHAVKQATLDPGIIKTLSADGAELYGNTPEQFREFLIKELAKYKDLVHQMGGIRLD